MWHHLRTSRRIWRGINPPSLLISQIRVSRIRLMAWNHYLVLMMDASSLARSVVPHKDDSWQSLKPNFSLTPHFGIQLSVFWLMVPSSSSVAWNYHLLMTMVARVLSFSNCETARPSCYMFFLSAAQGFGLLLLIETGGNFPSLLTSYFKFNQFEWW